MAHNHGQWKVGVIGLGKMGSALADALLASRLQTTVWNRTSTKAEPLAEAGAKVARSVSEAARNSGVLVVCLTNYAAIKEALMTEDVAVALRGKVLVDLTSMRSEDLRELSGWADANGVSFLKGSILTYPDDVRAGEGWILYGGGRELFDAIAPVLQAMGGRPAHVGNNVDDGTKVARACVCFLFLTLVGFLYGAAACHRAQAPVETYARDVVPSVVKSPVLTGMLERLARASLARRYDQDVQATLNIWNEGLAGLIHNVSAHGLDPGLLNAVKALLDRAAAQGFGEQDLAAVFETLIGDGRHGRRSVAGGDA